MAQLISACPCVAMRPYFSGLNRWPQSAHRETAGVHARTRRRMPPAVNVRSMDRFDRTCMPARSCSEARSTRPPLQAGHRLAVTSIRLVTRSSRLRWTSGFRRRCRSEEPSRRSCVRGGSVAAPALAGRASPRGHLNPLGHSEQPVAMDARFSEAMLETFVRADEDPLLLVVEKPLLTLI